MDRNKMIALSVGVVALLAAVTLGLHEASASTWHTYTGDVYAGHAYGLDVPPNAKSYEIDLAGDANATAKLAFFDPSGAKLGYYELSSTLTSASVASPSAGEHVLYVYDLAGNGALTLKVDSDTAPQADLSQIPLTRADVSVASQDAAGQLDKVISAKLDQAPVFVTLLYDGSAQDLNAQVASDKGNVVTVSHETATAFSPGVWTSQTGTRTSDPGNLDGVAYTVTVHAQSFQGDMVLTTLALDLSHPPAAQPPQEPSNGEAPAPQPGTVKGSEPAGTFAFQAGKAIAFQADKGTLVLRDPKASQQQASPNGSSSRRESAYVSDAISIYAPDDSLLTFVKLDSQTPTTKVDLPTSGEYVAFVNSASNKAVLAQLEGASAAPRLRELPLAKETFKGTVDNGGLGAPVDQSFTLTHTPVALQLRIDPNSVGVLSDATLSNAKGVVAEANDIASFQGADFLAWSEVNHTNFASGEHKLSISGLVSGSYDVTSTFFVRSAPHAAMVKEPMPGNSTAGDAPPPPPGPDAPPAPPSQDADRAPSIAPVGWLRLPFGL
jgi:hypothetical protein